MARPREFDEEEALTRIMEAFWRSGYEATSMSDIENATGLNKQSLYRIYKDKRAMYLAALDLYEQKEVAAAAEALAKPGDATQRIKRVFDAALAETKKDGPRRGCFLCNAAIDQGQSDPATLEFVGGAMKRVESAFEAALMHSAPYNKDKEKRTTLSGKLLAGYFGLRVLVKAGLPAAQLRQTANAFLAEI